MKNKSGQGDRGAVTTDPLTPEPFVVGAALVLDTVANLDRFVTLNLRKGIDHLVVFLDDPDNPLPASAADPRFVTVVRLDDAWWNGRRPARLNRRQRVVANFARVALDRLGGVDWLVFLDGDEIALIDHGVLGSIPADLKALRLRPLEAVSSEASASSQFKKRLSSAALRRLEAEGLIREAENSSYFHGHATGKIAVRPEQDVRVHVHTATDEAGAKLPRFSHPRLKHLHFESVTPEEFVRKWTALAASGPDPALLGDRRVLLREFQQMQDLEPGRREELARELYDRHVRDDVERLDSMGVLVQVDVARQTHVAQPLDHDRGEELRSILEDLSRVPKRFFLPGVSTGALLEAISSSS